MGFVQQKQLVIINLEAFPFIPYGFLEGEVEHVSLDAIIDEARGLVYPARIRITGSTLRTERLGIGGSSGGSPQNVSGTNTSDRAGAARPDRELVSGEEQARANNLNNALALTQPGMSVTAEVKTGTRSVISYLLSPIAKETSEAGRER